MAFIKKIRTSDAGDSELLRAYREKHDLEALAQLYQRYMDLVYGLCLKYLPDAEAAKDAVMQVFEVLVEKLQKHEVAYFKGWLCTVAKNHCLMQLRADKHTGTVALEPNIMQSEPGLHLNGELQQEARFTQLEHCLQALQPEQRLAVDLFYLQGKSYNEIVTATGFDWNKVRSLIQNGRRNLKLCMEQEESV